MSAKATRGRRDNLMRSVNELRDQLAVAQNGLSEATSELRKAELLAEKETAGQAPILRGRPSPTRCAKATGTRRYFDSFA